MASTDKASILPYPDFNDIRVQINEPMSAAYFNMHIAKMMANINALKNASPIQHATDTQWGTIKLATVNDILNDNGDKNAVLTNKVLNEVTEETKVKIDKLYQITDRLTFTKNFEWMHGEFVVGLNEKIAKRVTKNPDRVVFAQVYFIPYGYEDMPFFTACSKKTTVEAWNKQPKTIGVVNFTEKYTPKEYDEFHVYYHKSGYILVDNGRYDDSQTQIKVAYNLLIKNT